jgi:hypothetical protein
LVELRRRQRAGPSRGIDEDDPFLPTQPQEHDELPGRQVRDQGGCTSFQVLRPDPQPDGVEAHLLGRRRKRRQGYFSARVRLYQAPNFRQAGVIVQKAGHRPQARRAAARLPALQGPSRAEEQNRQEESCGGRIAQGMRGRVQLSPPDMSLRE